MSKPRIAKAVTKGVIYASAFYIISESEIPEKFAESVKNFNKDHLIQPRNLKPFQPQEKTALKDALLKEFVFEKQNRLLKGSVEQNTWSKPLVWFPGAKREEDVEGGDGEWKIVGEDGRIVGVEKDVLKTVGEVNGKELQKEGEASGSEKKEEGKEDS